MENQENLERDTEYDIVGAAIEVHNTLGCSHEEDIYLNAMQTALNERKIPFTLGVVVNVTFRDTVVGSVIFDMLVDDKVAVEITTDEIPQEEKFRAMAYLRGTPYHRGVLLNFGGNRLEFSRVPHKKKDDNRK